MRADGESPFSDPGVGFAGLMSGLRVAIKAKPFLYPEKIGGGLDLKLQVRNHMGNFYVTCFFWMVNEKQHAGANQRPTNFL
jgi:hypothetical protein